MAFVSRISGTSNRDKSPAIAVVAVIAGALWLQRRPVLCRCDATRGVQL